MMMMLILWINYSFDSKHLHDCLGHNDEETQMMRRKQMPLFLPESSDEEEEKSISNFKKVFS